MKTIKTDTSQQLERFLSALFLPDDLIELRFIESWNSGGKKRSSVVRAAEWLRRDQIVLQHREIIDFSRRGRANVYFGVCPRPKEGDSRDDQIETVRCLWADIDHTTAENAYERWNTARVPPPSVVVSSGSGTHGYWLLDRDLRLRDERSSILAMLPHFYRSFGGDHVQNLSRILRVPGTFNCKDARNGQPLKKCAILQFRPELRYPLGAFARWFELVDQEQRHNRTRTDASALRGTSRPASARRVDIARIVRHLDRPSRDRSRRDFAVVCDLLRLGPQLR